VNIFSRPCLNEKMSAKKPGFSFVIPVKNPGIIMFSRSGTKGI